MSNLAIDSKLRGCDLVALRADDVAPNGYAVDRANVRLPFCIGIRLKKTGSRAVIQSKGFLPLRDINEMLIAYATAEGELASDIGVGAGPYATVLAEEIVKPGVEAVTMFRRVQVRVREGIGQEPWLGFNGLSEVHFAGRFVSNSPSTPQQVQPSEAASAWVMIKDSNDIRILEAFRHQYGASNPFYDRLAEARIENLTKQQAASPPSATVQQPSRPASNPTVAASIEDLLSERRRQQEAEAEAKRQKDAEIKRKQEAEAEERRKQEAEAEAKRQKDAAAEGNPDAEQRTLSADDRRNLIRQVQILLKERRCYTGDLDGASKNAQNAVNFFANSYSRKDGANIVRIELAKATMADFEAWLAWARTTDPAKGDVCFYEPKAQPTEVAKPKRSPRQETSGPARAPREQPASRARGQTPSMTGIQ